MTKERYVCCEGEAGYYNFIMHVQVCVRDIVEKPNTNEVIPKVNNNDSSVFNQTSVN